MTPNDPDAGDSAVRRRQWWTPRRTRAAGIGAATAGVVALASLALAGAPADALGPHAGPVGGALGMFHPVIYALFAAALLAANARYGAAYGRQGRTVAGLFALTLAGYAGAVLAVAAGRAVLGEVLVPVGVLVGAAYLASKLLATVYGIVCWSRAGTGRLAAGLFALVLPALFVLGPLALVGVPAAWIEAPIHLAFVALGYDLLAGDAIRVAGGDGVAG